MAMAVSEDATSVALQKDLSRFVLEGSLNTIFGTVIGGAFLVGFALVLGAEDSHIGLLAAMPPLLNLIQVFGSYLVARVGSAKRVCVVTSGFFRLSWLLILGFPLLLAIDFRSGAAVSLLIAAIAVASLFASLSGIAWMSWITPLVPDSIRGRFFGHRNMIAGFAGMIIALAGGRFIDYWQSVHQDPVQVLRGYSLLFGFGLFFGVGGWIVLTRISETKAMKSKVGDSFFRQLGKPLADGGFRKWIIFAVCWGFSVGIAGPFFSVYMIRTLNLSFSLIATFGLISGFFNTLGMRLWGSIMDDIGSKPLLIICSVVAGVIPLLWLLVSPVNYSILWAINILSGLAWSGIGLSTSHMLMSAAPKVGSSVYFAVFAAVTGISGALAPVVGGALVALFNPVSLLGFVVGPVQLVFVITAVGRLASLLLLKPVPAAKEMPVSEALSRLQELSRFELMRGGQRLSMLHVHFEHSMAYLAVGSLHLEGKMSRMVDKGAAVARQLESGSVRVETEVNRRLERWETLLDRMVRPLLRGVSVVLNFLRDDEDKRS